MHHYFNFNHSFEEAMLASKNNFEHAQAWNKQVSVNRDLGLVAQDYKQLDNISSLMTEFKSALQNKFGSSVGEAKYKEMILDNGSLTEKEAAKKFYNGLNYAVSFGTTGKDMKFSDDFLKNDASHQVAQSLQTVLPKIPHDFINELVKEYKNTHSNYVEINRQSHQIGQTSSRADQIKFVKENIDSMYTNTQRFKECLSEIKKFYADDMNPIASIVTAPVVFPVLAAASIVKTFGGEAGQMKMHDIIDSVGEKLTKMKDDVKSFFKASVSHKIQTMRQATPANTNDNRFKM